MGILGSAEAQSKNAELSDAPSNKPGTETSFASLKQIDAGLLNVGHAEAGRIDGPVKATIAGFDWGARTANIVAALWPERKPLPKLCSTSMLITALAKLACLTLFHESLPARANLAASAPKRVTVKSIVFAFGIIIFAFKATRTEDEQKVSKRKRLKTGGLEMPVDGQSSCAN